MYKGTHRSLQRKDAVHLVDVRAAQSRNYESDFIPTAANMGMADCVRERGQLMLEKTRAENEIGAAKARGDMREAAVLGSRLQTYCQRLGLIGARIKEINRQASSDTLYDAMNEVLSEELRRKVLDRANEIREQRRLMGAL